MLAELNNTSAACARAHVLCYVLLHVLCQIRLALMHFVAPFGTFSDLGRQQAHAGSKSIIIFFFFSFLFDCLLSFFLRQHKWNNYKHQGQTVDRKPKKVSCYDMFDMPLSLHGPKKRGRGG